MGKGQAFGEGFFDIGYLICAFIFGVKITAIAGNDPQVGLFGKMVFILAFGDSFHLVPRVYALFNGGTKRFPKALGFGRFMTSITMTVFYVVLYHVCMLRYGVINKDLSNLIYLLAGVRILICLFPQNKWFSSRPSLTFGILRNIPFFVLGALVAYLFYTEAKELTDGFHNMWKAILISFLCYAPVVFMSQSFPAIGMLMLPKTVAYLWMIYIGYSEYYSILG